MQQDFPYGSSSAAQKGNRRISSPHPSIHDVNQNRTSKLRRRGKDYTGRQEEDHHRKSRIAANSSSPSKNAIHPRFLLEAAKLAEPPTSSKLHTGLIKYNS
ncbi:hypothetical protein Nepgr_023089 [Nepenthes gracilis]|uniref:Uncharacterized protein n=1 Tax=Nepenthes gracilis TaxID=150966 RepID=A0AAD3T1Z3_NEPGR|nr:hypothetical protein Nepgr_023089 [Nepenthes gracilis]